MLVPIRVIRTISIFYLAYHAAALVNSKVYFTRPICLCNNIMLYLTTNKADYRGRIPTMYYLLLMYLTKSVAYFSYFFRGLLQFLTIFFFYKKHYVIMIINIIYNTLCDLFLIYF